MLRAHLGCAITDLSSRHMLARSVARRAVASFPQESTEGCVCPSNTASCHSNFCMHSVVHQASQQHDCSCISDWSYRDGLAHRHDGQLPHCMDLGGRRTSGRQRPSHDHMQQGQLQGGECHQHIAAQSIQGQRCLQEQCMKGLCTPAQLHLTEGSSSAQVQAHRAPAASALM